MTDPTGKKREGPPPPAKSEDENDRPTVSPPFDVEAFARASAAGGRLRTSGPPSFEPDDPRGARVTVTNEVELEQARAQSAMRSEPPRAVTPSLLSMADARAKSSSQGTLAVPRSPSPTSIEAAVLGALGTAASGPEITEETIEDPLGEMRARFKLGDYTGALEMSELLLAEDPGNLEAAECGENCRSVLEGMLAARLGALDRVPIVVVPRTQLRWLSMDHRAGFVLSLIDGSSSVEMILDVCGMPRLDALRILHELLQQKIVAFR